MINRPCRARIVPINTNNGAGDKPIIGGIVQINFPETDRQKFDARIQL